MQINFSLPTLHTGPGYTFLWDYLLESGRATAPLQKDPSLAAFLAFCMQNSSLSRAQLMQDLYVLYRLSKTAGYFVEFGATDGVTISNTYLLESELSWTGVVAEPSPHWHPALLANRKCKVDLRCVWTHTGEQLEFLAPQDTPELATLNSFREADHHARARSTNARVLRVPTVSLNDLLLENDAPRHFDYLSVDTEGSELAILGSLDMDRWQPRIITVEHNYVAAQREKIRALLAGFGYVRELETCSKWDDWYYHPEFVPAQA